MAFQTNKLYDGPPVPPEDILSVYVVLNGSLNMPPGKMASQAFHCGYYVGTNWGGFYWDDIVKQWNVQGRRVTVRIAKTEHVFNRVMAECEGFAAADEGLTVVARGSYTAYVTIPYKRSDAPKILSHSKVQLA